MRRKRCTLCGGKLANGICQECGLDNRKSDSRYWSEKKDASDEYEVEQFETETHQSESGEDLEEKESCQEEWKQILQENKNGSEEWKQILPKNEKQREKLEQILSKNEKQRAKLEQLLSEVAEERKKKGTSGEGIWTKEEIRRNKEAGAKDKGSSMNVPAGKKSSGKKGTKMIASIVLVVLFIVVLFINEIPSLVRAIQEFFLERNYMVADEEDPYTRTDAVLKEKGAFYENQLVEGEYVVGVHIPEGKYTIELMEGYGGMQVLDSEHSIYLYEFFSEEYEEGKDFITECEDVRLFAGATVKILSSGVCLRFSSENAQLNEMTGIKNPLTEQVHLKAEEKLTAGKDFEAGVYNLCYEGETEGEYGTFQWLVPGTVTEEARKERDAYTGSVFVKDQLRELGGLHCCNIVLPEDTVVYAQGVGVRLVPSEMIVSEDYASAYEYIDTEE